MPLAKAKELFNHGDFDHATEIYNRLIQEDPKSGDAYAGLTRGVFLEATAQVTVSKLITSARHGRLAAAAVVFNHGAGPARRRLILDPGEGTGGAPVSRDLALAPGQVGVVSADLPIPGARPWSPADPRLYRLTARLQPDSTAAGHTEENGRAGDSLAVRYGMRAVEVAGARLEFLAPR